MMNNIFNLYSFFNWNYNSKANNLEINYRSKIRRYTMYNNYRSADNSFSAENPSYYEHLCIIFLKNDSSFSPENRKVS